MICLNRLNPFHRKFSHHLLAWCLITVILFCVSLPHSVAAFKRVNDGDPMVAFKLRDTAGSEISLTDFKGKILAILFFKHPCNRCDMAMRTLQGLYDRYNEDKGFELIAIYCPRTDEKITSDERDAVNKIMAEGGYTFPVLFDEGLKVFSDVGVITLPSLAIVGKDGKLVDDQPGYPRLNGDKIVTEKVRVALGFAPARKKMVRKSYKPTGQAAKHLKFGRQMYSMGFLDKAIKKLQASIKEDPDFAPPHTLLAKIYDKKGKVDEATVEYNNAIVLTPENVKLHKDYGFFLLRQKNLVEAQLEFELIKELSPNSGDGLFGLGLVSLAQKNEKEALANFKEAIALFEGEKTTSSTSSGKGDLFNMMRKKRSAKKVRLNPNEAQVHAELGKLLANNGKLEEANKELLKAIAKYRKIINKLMEGGQRR